MDGLKSGQFKPGDLLPSESEIGELFSVGRNSVRTALNNLSHGGYVETKKGIGTFCVAESTASNMNIGFICFFAHTYIFPRMVEGCDRVLYRNGYHLLLNQSEFNLQKERDILQKLIQKKVGGIIIEPFFSGSGQSNAELLHEIEARGVPVVLIDNYFPGEEFCSIAMADREGGRLMAEHLVSKGHRKIAVVFKENYYPKLLRKQGSCDYLAEHGLKVPAEWLIGYGGPPVADQIAAAAEGLFKDPDKRPSAVICTSDEESIEVIRAADGHGIRVPDDLSIVSFDNSSLAALPRVSLTSIDHPSRYIGDLAATLMLQRIRYPEVKNKPVFRINPELIERSSVAQVNIVKA